MDQQNNGQLNNETGHVAKKFFSDTFNETENVSVSSAQVGNEMNNVNGISNSIDEEFEVLDFDEPEFGNDMPSVDSNLSVQNSAIFQSTLPQDNVDVPAASVEPKIEPRIESTIEPKPEPTIEPKPEPTIEPSIDKPETKNNTPPTDPTLSMQNSPIFQSSLPQNNVKETVTHMEPVTTPIDEPGTIGNDLMNKQPLSAASLGVSTIGEDKHDEVVEDSKFFTKANADNKTSDVQMVDLPDPKIGSIIDDLPKKKIDLDRLTKDYVGEDYAKFKASTFNSAAFILGSLYFAYRNMLLGGIIVFLITLFLVFVVKSVMVILVVIAFRLILALSFSFIYLSVVKFRVKLMAKDKKATEEELSVKCQKKAKTNVAYTLLMALIIIGFGVLFTVSKAGTNIDDIKGYYKNVYDEKIGGIDEKVKENDQNNQNFDGTFKVTDFDVSTILEINPPSVFVDNSINYGTKYIYTTTGTGTYNQCSFTIRELSKYPDAEDFMGLMAKHYDKKITDASYNNIDWYSISVTNNEGTTYYSAAMIKDRPIIFQYLSGADTQGGECNKYYIQILESLKIKEK